MRTMRMIPTNGINVVPIEIDVVFCFECTECKTRNYFSEDEISAGFICVACDTIVDIEPFDFKIEYTYKGIYKQVYKLLKKFYSSNESKLVLKKTVKKLSSFSKESLYKECLKNVE